MHRAAFLQENEVLDRVATTGFGFQVEMTELERSLGAVIAEVPITFDERIAGESKLDSSIFVEELVMVTKGGPGARVWPGRPSSVLEVISPSDRSPRAAGGPHGKR